MIVKPTKEFINNRYILIKSISSALYDFETKYINTEYSQYIATAHEIVKRIKQNENNHFVAMNCSAEMSYSKDKIDPFSKKRIQTTLGRYIRRQLEIDTTKINDTTLDFFCNKTNAFVIHKATKDKFKVISGQELMDYYKSNKQFASCLSFSGAFRTELYVMNPDKVSLLVYDDKARTLLWTCDDGTKIIDRSYSNDHVVSAMMTSWGQENGYRMVTHYESLYITMKYGKYMPSIDTFYNIKFDKSDKTVILSNRSFTGCSYTCYDLVCTPDGKSHKCSNNHCTKFVPDDDSCKINNKYYCLECIEKLKDCSICKSKHSNSIDCCSICEKQFMRKCSNISCLTRQIKYNKLSMIKMKKLNATKICFVCSKACMNKVNPNWILEDNHG